MDQEDVIKCVEFVNWDINSVHKAQKLVIVKRDSYYHEYIARRDVPTGIDIFDSTYWQEKVYNKSIADVRKVFSEIDYKPFNGF